MAGLLDFLGGGQAQMPGQQQPSGLARLFQPEIALPMAAALLGNQGNAANFGNAFAAGGQAMGQQKELQAQTAQKNQTLDFFRKNAPEYAQMIDAGMPVGDAFKLYTEQRYAQPSADGRPASIQEFEYGRQNPEFAEMQRNKGRDAVLTATDKKAIFAAEDELPQIDNTIATLSRAIELNPATSEGLGAGTVGQWGTYLPDALEPETAAPTREYQDIMTQEAATLMSETLKGATTDRELSIFMGIIGDVSKPKEVRQRALERMLQLAQRKKQTAQDRINQLRGGTYYQPQGGGQPSGGEGWNDLGDGVRIRQLP